MKIGILIAILSFIFCVVVTYKPPEHPRQVGSGLSPSISDPVILEAAETNDKSLGQVKSIDHMSLKNNSSKCHRDGECESGECKNLKCVVRLKPKGDLGARCVFDGDCKSDECKKLRCVVNNKKTGYK